ncbi:MAG: peptidylprolyl isomerase [Sumerlaeia bacterium]
MKFSGDEKEPYELMRLWNKLLTLASAVLLASAPAVTPAQGNEKVDGPALDQTKDHYVVMDTNKGQIVIELFGKESPILTQNFVNLIEGTKVSVDPRTGQKEKKPFFDGLTFHRVVPGFVIQGGDPLGTGTGGPGFRLDDEDNDYSFKDFDYALSMARSAAGNSGSQFFITTKGSHPAHLDGDFTVFGKVVEGKDVVDAIEAVGNARTQKPSEKIVMEKVTVAKVPAGTPAEQKPWAAASGGEDDSMGGEPASQPDSAPSTQPTTKPSE